MTYEMTTGTSACHDTLTGTNGWGLVAVPEKVHPWVRPYALRSSRDSPSSRTNQRSIGRDRARRVYGGSRWLRRRTRPRVCW